MGIEFALFAKRIETQTDESRRQRQEIGGSRSDRKMIGVSTTDGGVRDRQGPSSSRIREGQGPTLRSLRSSELPEIITPRHHQFRVVKEATQAHHRSGRIRISTLHLQSG